MGLTEGSLFVSYSHSDRDLVVALLKLQPDLWFAAFLDFLHTPRGSQWQKQHQRMIVAADRVLVFWSAHAAKSRHVEEEWKYANSLGKSIIPVLIDRTPLPGELDALHAVTLGDFIQTAHLPGFLVRKATYLAKYGTVTGCAAIVVALLPAVGAAAFWRQTGTLVSMVMAWLASWLALGCFVTGLYLLRFGYRWSILKETITGEVIHALKSDRGLPARGSPTSYQPRMVPSGNHRDVNVTVSPLALRVEERISSWKALRKKRQRYKQLKQEADARGRMEAPQVGFNKLKCPHCASRFEIAETTEHKERRCPRCLTSVVPVPPYPLDELLGHTFYDDVCTKCGCGTSFVKAFGTNCSPD